MKLNLKNIFKDELRQVNNELNRMMTKGNLSNLDYIKMQELIFEMIRLEKLLK